MNICDKIYVFCACLLETKVKDFYLFFVTEQKRIAEEAYLKAGVRYEW